ncbi:MAG: hypothetical protein GY927_18660, partial [bacterium]|nr:hypothetical protein [bacterium]
QDICSRYALRLGLRQIKGVGKTEAELVMQMRQQPGGPQDRPEDEKARPVFYKDIRDFWLRSGLARSMIERFADADAFRSIGLDRRKALWAVRALDPHCLNSTSMAGKMPLFDRLNGKDPVNEIRTDLPLMPQGEHVIQDYRYLSLSLKAHPVSFLRDDFRQNGMVENGQLESIANGRRITIAGLIVVRQRPGSAKGVVFMTLEDETGIANVIVWSKVFEHYRS